MWLLDVSTLELKDFVGSKVPPYAILSHTWSDGEVSFDKIQYLNESTSQKPGFVKIQRFCTLAQNSGFQYAWVDTCCIDKRSSAELTEAINSMYKWYQHAGLCIIYLEDVPGVTENEMTSQQAQIEAFRASRWFKRGWTLQELIANNQRSFYAQDWSSIAGGKDQESLVEICSTVTRISSPVLTHSRKLSQVCIAERMSWASRRETTRPEDTTYSLMGIFNVNMPVLYGEGHAAAFRRLQNELLKQSFDQTLFAWRGPYESSGLLAQSPDDFADTPRLGLWAPQMLAPSVMTSTGILIRPCLYKGDRKDMTALEAATEQAALQCDVMTTDGWAIMLIYLKPIRNTFCWVNGRICQAYRRVCCTTWKTIPCDYLVGDRSSYEDLLVLEDEHFDLVHLSISQDNERWSRDQRQDRQVRLMPCDGVNLLD